MISLPWIATMLAGTALLSSAPWTGTASLAGSTQRATAPQERPGLELELPARGLDEANAPVLERSLRVLVDESDPPEALLREVRVDPEAGRIELTVAPGKTLRLSQVERALASIRGEIPRPKLRIASARLVVEATEDEDLGERIRRALEATRLFESLEVEEVADAPRYLVTVQGGTEEASAAAVAKTLQEVSPALELKDVLWTAPEPKDGERPGA